VTRPGRSARGPTLADIFAADAEAAVLRVLRDAGTALTAGEVKRALMAGGVSKSAADGAWPRIQRKIRSHDRVTTEGNRYRWAAGGPEVSPDEALNLLVRGRSSARRKEELALVVRAALVGTTSEVAPPRENDAGARSDPESAARRRQGEIDAVRTLAELAIEVEELTVNEASSVALIHRVRARVHRSGLEPIDRAGDETTFDRKRHRAIGRPIRDGAPVVVVRPGYVWKSPTEDVLIARAVVEE
jgi:hypothetical protein